MNIHMHIHIHRYRYIYRYIYHDISTIKPFEICVKTNMRETNVANGGTPPFLGPSFRGYAPLSVRLVQMTRSCGNGLLCCWVFLVFLFRGVARNGTAAIPLQMNSRRILPWPQWCSKESTEGLDRSERCRVAEVLTMWMSGRPIIDVFWLVVWNINFIFPYIGNNHPNWLSYFSEGFKPPTSFFSDELNRNRGDFWWWVTRHITWRKNRGNSGDIIDQMTGGCPMLDSH